MRILSTFAAAALALGACAAPAPQASPDPAPPSEAKSTERLTPEVRYYLIADA